MRSDPFIICGLVFFNNLTDDTLLFTGVRDVQAFECFLIMIMPCLS